MFKCIPTIYEYIPKLRLKYNYNLYFLILNKGEFTQTILVLCNKTVMKFIRWMSSLLLLILLISLIFKAGSSLVNTILLLSFVVFILDMVFEYKQ